MSGSAGDLIDSGSGATILRVTATTTWTAYPTVAGDKIKKFIVDSDIDNSGGRRVRVAYSSGSSDFVSLAPGDSYEEIGGGQTQIWIRTASSTATVSLSFIFE